MKSLNMVQLIGHLGNDPEIKENEGKMITKFSIATSETWLDKTTSEKRTSIEWHRVVCFNQVAKIAKAHLKKGAKVYLGGKIKTSKWQDKNNENHYATDIIAEELIILDSKQAATRDGNYNF